MLTGCVTDSVTTVVLPTDLLSIASCYDFLKCVNKSFDYISIVPSAFSIYQYLDQVTVIGRHQPSHTAAYFKRRWNIKQSVVCSYSSIQADSEINKVLHRDGLLPHFWSRCSSTFAVDFQMRWMRVRMFFFNFWFFETFCFSPSKKLKTDKETF